MHWPSFFRRKEGQSEAPAPPAVPPGQRVYAIGDVHGCADQLIQLLDLIEQDHARREPAELTVILLGDLVNRGPASAQVIGCVQGLVDSGVGRLLKGNHEELFICAGRGDHRAARIFMASGGKTTLMSFGLSEDEIEHGNYHDLAALMKTRIPREIIAFLEAAEDKILIGDYLFVHAGIRPGVPIPEQKSADLRWIRHEFLSSDAAHGSFVVHGHTITATIDERENRIGIDTGAYRSGVLSAVGFDGTQRWHLCTPGGGDTVGRLADHPVST